MASHKTKFTVGLFVAGGLTLGLIAIIWLGMSQFLEKGKYYASYFDESVQGLDVDSPVKYRGLPIGRVAKIRVAPDSRLIEVIVKIENDMKPDKDMVAQLKIVGITGAMFVEIDRRKAEEPDLSPQINFASEFPILATRPSEVSKIMQGIDDVLQKIKAMDLDGIVTNVNETLASVNTMVKDMEVKGMSSFVKSQLSSLSVFLEQTTGNINKLIERIDDHPSQLIFGEPKPARVIQEGGKK